MGDVTLNVAKGHFATSHSHTNYFIDVTAQKASLRETEAVAQQLAERHLSNTMVDTILCLDGTRVIGTCLACELTQAGYCSINEERDIYVLRAELGGVAVSALFDYADLPDYASYPAEACPLCRQGTPLDAVVNSFGYSKV